MLVNNVQNIYASTGMPQPEMRESQKYLQMRIILIYTHAFGI